MSSNIFPSGKSTALPETDGGNIFSPAIKRAWEKEYLSTDGYLKNNPNSSDDNASNKDIETLPSHYQNKNPAQNSASSYYKDTISRIPSAEAPAYEDYESFLKNVYAQRGNVFISAVPSAKTQNIYANDKNQHLKSAVNKFLYKLPDASYVKIIDRTEKKYIYARNYFIDDSFYTSLKEMTSKFKEIFGKKIEIFFNGKKIK